MNTQRATLIHCMSGWRAAFCVLDNLTPHRVDESCPEDNTELAAMGAGPNLVGRGPFRAMCWLHDQVGNWGHQAS